jgi:cytochrome c oxidase subunit 1
MPRRYHSYADAYAVWNVLSTAGAGILAVGFTLPLIYLAWSLKTGEVAGDNPWGAVGLEWNTTSPPPTENFTTQPVVTWEAYEHSTPLEGHVV